MNKNKKYPIKEAIASSANINKDQYESMYKASILHPDFFWNIQAKKLLDWSHNWNSTYTYDFKNGYIKWFEGGELNASFNCIDRHLNNNKNKTAIIWEGDNKNNDKKISYNDLYKEVCKLANGLKSLGIKKGDRICIYMPMIPEAAFAMLACARIGAIHTVVFGGFSPEALRDRIIDADCNTVITADQGIRGGKVIPLKDNVDIAIDGLKTIQSVIVIKHTNGDIRWNSRDICYHELTQDQDENCPTEPMGSEDPLFILYTSGSTGKPKGVLHTTGGYLLGAAISQKYIFDCKKDDVHWCTADIGWITGHSYIIYGPLLNGTTTLMFEGIPTYPDAGRCWEICDKHGVNIFYTAPTVIRSLMSRGDKFVKNHSRKTIRLLGTVGEPINPEAWEWYYKTVGESKCPIIDTWWQTETGSIMISPLPGATTLKPGSACKPFFGIEVALLDEDGNEIIGAGEGSLVIKKSWPSQIRTVFNNHQRLIDTYFKKYPNYFYTGDGAKRDEDGYYWITGRVDDVLNVSGHRLGTAEIESALVLHTSVAEAAVVGFPHSIKGQGIYCFVTTMENITTSDELKNDLIKHVAKEIGGIAKPDVIQWSADLPKTRSGKIMRRILRKIANDQIDDLGDLSTLADPKVIKELIFNKK